ncbi:hypothetical protein DWV16_05065 [Anaerotruncus sp. AF02-27]|nr:hypothetical protein DWV16_05065 [Anaerotruncus sp. AF02-27]
MVSSLIITDFIVMSSFFPDILISIFTTNTLYQSGLFKSTANCICSKNSL